MTNTQLPKEVQEHIRKQAEGHVQKHYASFIYPSALEDLFADGATVYALQLQTLQQDNQRLKDFLERIANETARQLANEALTEPVKPEA